jgi:DNA-binding transcriptional regulator YiaG
VNRLESKTRLPYNQELDYRMIRLIRHTRNLTLKEYGEVIGIDSATISRLENGQLKFTPHYEAIIRDGCKQIRMTGQELATIRELVALKR